MNSKKHPLPLRSKPTTYTGSRVPKTSDTCLGVTIKSTARRGSHEKIYRSAAAKDSVRERVAAISCRHRRQPDSTTLVEIVSSAVGFRRVKRGPRSRAVATSTSYTHTPDSPNGFRTDPRNPAHGIYNNRPEPSDRATSAVSCIVTATITIRPCAVRRANPTGIIYARRTVVGGGRA